MWFAYANKIYGYEPPVQDVCMEAGGEMKEGLIKDASKYYVLKTIIFLVFFMKW